MDMAVLLLLKLTCLKVDGLSPPEGISIRTPKLSTAVFHYGSLLDSHFAQPDRPLSAVLNPASLQSNLFSLGDSTFDFGIKAQKMTSLEKTSIQTQTIMTDFTIILRELPWV